MKIHSINADVYIRRIYTCAVCGVQKIGEKQYSSLTAGSSDGIKVLIDEQKAHAYCMPQGWRYTGVYRCPDHLSTVLQTSAA